jgi:hypothetical protein
MGLSVPNLEDSDEADRIGLGHEFEFTSAAFSF